MNGVLTHTLRRAERGVIFETEECLWPRPWSRPRSVTTAIDRPRAPAIIPGRDHVVVCGHRSGTAVVMALNDSGHEDRPWVDLQQCTNFALCACLLWMLEKYKAHNTRPSASRSKHILFNDRFGRRSVNLHAPRKKRHTLVAGVVCSVMSRCESLVPAVKHILLASGCLLPSG